ncbi:MAG: hypothetical protein ACOCV2_06520, partial [Persicimonas sp.]
VFTMRDASVRKNRSAETGGGVFVGNQERTATFPIKVTVDHPQNVYDNGPDDLVVRWRGERLRVSGQKLLK